jgi:hypothetical protein
VKAHKFPAYQANISAYTVACLSWKTSGGIDFERIWAHQAISPELGAMIEGWTGEIDRRLRATAKTRMPSEWAKKVECWEAIRDLPLKLPASLPPELRPQSAKPVRRTI